MSKKVVSTSAFSKQNNTDIDPQPKPVIALNNRKSDQPMPGKVAKRIKIYKTLLPCFQKQYPKCFTIPQSPLAIDIAKMLVEKENNQTEADIKKFLAMYVNTVTYNDSIIEGANRIDLDGNNVSIISAEDAVFAKDKIVAIKAARNRSQ